MICVSNSVKLLVFSYDSWKNASLLSWTPKLPPQWKNSKSKRGPPSSTPQQGFSNDTISQNRGNIDKLLRIIVSYFCVVREGFQMWALVFFLAGKNRPTLPVFNPGLTSLNLYLLSAAVILTYICQSTGGRLQLQGVTTEPRPHTLTWGVSFFCENPDFALSLTLFIEKSSPSTKKQGKKEYICAQ